ncbi:MAG: REP element-mobilizing transposase RayT [Planctomycetota bacterium]|jgi:REP element-mobilizing transposase RayT
MTKRHFAMTQGFLRFDQSPGGWRPGAGRKKRRLRNGERRVASHQKRESFTHIDTLHVTLRLSKGLPSMRRSSAFEAIRNCFMATHSHLGMRIHHYCVMSNHMQIVVKATNRDALAKAMKGLNVRIVRSLNKLWKRTGSILAERYHVAIVRAQARYCRALTHLINYVLNNAAHHGLHLKGPDPFSSRVNAPFLQSSPPQLT